MTIYFCHFNTDIAIEFPSWRSLIEAVCYVPYECHKVNIKNVLLYRWKVHFIISTIICLLFIFIHLNFNICSDRVFVVVMWVLISNICLFILWQKMRKYNFLYNNWKYVLIMWIEWHCELLYEIIFKKMTLSAIFFKFFEIITNNNSYHFVTHYELILYNTKQQKTLS